MFFIPFKMFKCDVYLAFSKENMTLCAKQFKHKYVEMLFTAPNCLLLYKNLQGCCSDALQS